MVDGCKPISRVKNTTKKIVNDLKLSRRILKKKVGIARFQNKTFVTDQSFERLFQDYLSRSIKAACPDLLLIKPGDPGCPGILVKPPRWTSGGVANFALAQAGKQVGLNAIIIGVLQGLSGGEEDRGVLWFKGSHYFVRILVGVAIFDTQTGAKLLDESFIHMAEIDEADFNSVRAKKMEAASVLNDAMRKAGASMGIKICDSLRTLPWKGSVVSVKGHTIVIPSGKKAGIQPGDVFEVFDIGRRIKGAEGYRFFLPGPKIGEIKIAAVFPDRAEGYSISGDRIRPGSSIQPKR